MVFMEDQQTGSKKIYPAHSQFVFSIRHNTHFTLREKLFGGTVLPNKTQLGGTVLPNKMQLGGTVAFQWEKNTLREEVYWVWFGISPFPNQKEISAWGSAKLHFIWQNCSAKLRFIWWNCTAKQLFLSMLVLTQANGYGDLLAKNI